GSDMSIVGNIECNGPAQVFGRIKGELRASDLVICDGAQIEGSVIAQTMTSCAMTLPSICAPSQITRSEARNSPLIRPNTCAGPLHSILPTIDMSEPMQEFDAFVIGSRPGGCSTTDHSGWTALATTSSKVAAVL